MGLRLKFNLTLVLVFALGFAAVGFNSRQMLQDNAREEVLRNARLMMDTALAVREYTVEQVKPHLDKQLQDVFLPQTVAAYASGGYVHGAAQDEALATWEPSIDRPPAFRPDLLMIEGPEAPKQRRALPPDLHPWATVEAESDAEYYEYLLEAA